jgi:hypothetical protein
MGCRLGSFKFDHYFKINNSDFAIPVYNSVRYNELMKNPASSFKKTIRIL